MSHPIHEPRPDRDDPTGLHALVDELEAAIVKARAGDRTFYGTARTAAQAVESRARRVDVDLHDESFTADRDQAYAADRIRRGERR